MRSEKEVLEFFVSCPHEKKIMAKDPTKGKNECIFIVATFQADVNF